MLLSSNITKLDATRRQKHTCLNRFYSKKTTIDKKLEAYFTNHLICFCMFVFFGMPLLILLGVALSTTIFGIFFYIFTTLV